jgi:hypothetical protein
MLFVILKAYLTWSLVVKIIKGRRRTNQFINTFRWSLTIADAGIYYFRPPILLELLTLLNGRSSITSQIYGEIYRAGTHGFTGIPDRADINIKYSTYKLQRETSQKSVVERRVSWYQSRLQEPFTQRTNEDFMRLGNFA